MSVEEWRNVWGYAGKYQVSNKGRIRTIKYIKPILKKDGYMYVNLSNSMIYPRRNKWCSVHRLVAKAFCKNPKKKPQVNHLNGVTTDNKASNLEWCTAEENARHAWSIGLLSKEKCSVYHKPIPVYCSNGKKYVSIRDAANQLFLSETLIKRVIDGERNTTGGLKFWRGDSDGS